MYYLSTEHVNLMILVSLWYPLGLRVGKYWNTFNGTPTQTVGIWCERLTLKLQAIDPFNHCQLHQMSSALEYLHSGKDVPSIVHGDVKAVRSPSFFSL